MSDERLERLVRIRDLAKIYGGPTDIRSIKVLCDSQDADERLLGLSLIQLQPYTREWFDLAKTMVVDSDNTCRWQALIAIDPGIQIQPEWVWEVILEFGDTEDEDMQAAIGCVLLEDLLYCDFETYFPKLKAVTLNAPSNWFKTAMYCNYAVHKDNRAEYQTFLDRAEG